MSSRKLLPLPALKADQLYHAATCLGLATTGIKASIENAITHYIAERRPFAKVPRIISVDMGIKNLGLCVLEAPSLVGEPRTRDGIAKSTAVKVLAWKKVDVLSQVAPMTITTPAKMKGQRAAQVADASIFGPSKLSKTALSIAQDLLHTYQPSHILIERQRFRSGGASAVQEWTLRVNMLESMLYACFETMKSNSNLPSVFPDTVEMSPARVARFWCGGTSEAEGTDVEAALSRPQLKSKMLLSKQSGKIAGRDKLAKQNKIDKNVKIAVVKAWLAAAETPLPPHLDVQLEFTDEARLVADAFGSDTKKTRGGRKEAALSTDSGPVKLDDLADSLLQGLAWVRWEENRRKLAALLQEPQG
ncbi:uncharacterized protein LTR77_004552 [Saxophila tyrrhenica]|uniref:Mitochondrial resolvase Ydc2 catalytic domain-containing protein n=1 Tax=Saxophila tyrrhenica TaxID=1690608 RepID=A0AAV9PE82_9PEZI|nr:hypothetical protein LTR77_004552 [Saxophila tyrrhenica]